MLRWLLVLCNLNSSNLLLLSDGGVQFTSWCGSIWLLFCLFTTRWTSPTVWCWTMNRKKLSKRSWSIAMSIPIWFHCRLSSVSTCPSWWHVGGTSTRWVDRISIQLRVLLIDTLSEHSLAGPNCSFRICDRSWTRWKSKLDVRCKNFMSNLLAP